MDTEEGQTFFKKGQEGQKIGVLTLHKPAWRLKRDKEGQRGTKEGQTPFL